MAKYAVCPHCHNPLSQHEWVKVVRCKNCRWAHEAPPVDEWHLECRVRPLCRHYTPDTGFCHLGEPREVDA